MKELEFDHEFEMGPEDFCVNVVALMDYEIENDSHDDNKCPSIAVYNKINEITIFHNGTQIYFGALPDKVRQEIENRVWGLCDKLNHVIEPREVSHEYE